VDTERPSAARIYDWYLGGDQNWAVDREFGKRAVEVFPHARELARQNRDFLGRLVKAAMESGIRQFLDLGSGVPTVGNVHEIVHDNLPEGERASVVYVDYEPVAAAHSTVLLEQDGSTDWAGLVQADLRDVDAVLKHRSTKRLLDFRQPVCLLLIGVLHFIGGDDRPGEIVDRYRRELAPGSWLAVSHFTDENLPAEDVAAVHEVAEAYQRTSNPLWVRRSAEIGSWFGGWPMVEPGLVPPADWRADEPLTPAGRRARPFGWCGVAARPR
jgi:O-methyltransferase involved in polyketide biosynthesis